VRHICGLIIITNKKANPLGKKLTNILIDKKSIYNIEAI